MYYGGSYYGGGGGYGGSGLTGLIIRVRKSIQKIVMLTKNVATVLTSKNNNNDKTIL